MKRLKKGLITKSLWTAMLSFLIIAVNLSVYAADDIAVMGLIGDKAILRVDGVHRVIKQQAPAEYGLRLIDIADDKKSIVLEINGELIRYRLGEGTKAAVSVVHLPADEIGMHRTAGLINNKPIEFIVDTGATFVSLNKNIAAKLEINVSDAERTGTAETANGLVKVYFVNLESIQVGSIRLNNIEAVVHNSDFPSAVLLGMSFLRQVEMRREGDILSLTTK